MDVDDGKKAFCSMRPLGGVKKKLCSMKGPLVQKLSN